MIIESTAAQTYTKIKTTNITKRLLFLVVCYNIDEKNIWPHGGDFWHLMESIVSVRISVFFSIPRFHAIILFALNNELRL